jgi:hypothetical protein
MPFAGGSTDLLDAVREREQVVGSVGHHAPPLPRTVTYAYSSEASDVFILGFVLSREHLPERYGPWQSAYHCYRIWTNDGTFDRILERLQVRLNAEGLLDLDTWL